MLSCHKLSYFSSQGDKKRKFFGEFNSVSHFIQDLLQAVLSIDDRKITKSTQIELVEL